MTFSIVARSGDVLGVATATRSLAVGAVVPAAAPGTGALATQARTNRAFRSRGLTLLRDGLAPADVLRVLAQEDEGYAMRQVVLLAADGRTAVWTGPGCTPWAGGWGRADVAVAGNLLTGREVLEAMDHAFSTADDDAPLDQRLVAALAAGDAAGGDLRGRQSAALLVVSGEAEEAWPPRTVVDLRVDDHPDPVGELARLAGLARAEAAVVASPPGA